jgi:hypothetical protein
MPQVPLAIADAIARVIAEFSVDALNGLAPPLKLATDRDLTGLERKEFQALVDARCADVEAGWPDDGVLRRILALDWVGRGLTEPEAQCRAAWDVAARDHEEEERLHARPEGWVRPPPPPPRLRRDEVKMAIGEIIDQEGQRGTIDFVRPGANHTAMLPVAMSTMWRLCQTFPEGQWVLARRDRNPDPQALVDPHITEAGLEVLMGAIRSRLGMPPPAWPMLLTHAEFEKRRKDQGITPERWADIESRYKVRLQSLSSAPKLEVRNRSAHPLTDREWAKQEGIDQKNELPLLREVYIGPRRKPRKA